MDQRHSKPEFPGNFSFDVDSVRCTWVVFVFIGLGSIWDEFGVGLGSVRGRFGVGLGSVWDRFGVVLG